MTEERLLNYRPAAVIVKNIQTHEEMPPAKKSAENYGVFEEYAKDREKYRSQKRASVSGGFIEEENYKLGGMSRRGTNYLEVARLNQRDSIKDQRMTESSENVRRTSQKKNTRSGFANTNEQTNEKKLPK